MTTPTENRSIEFKKPKVPNRNDNDPMALKCGPNNNNPDFAFTTYFREFHCKIIYAVEFCNKLSDGEPIIFATCGSNVVTIYECLNDGSVKLLQCYADPSPTELYYTLAWSFDPTNSKLILAVAGFDRVIRIISPTTQNLKKQLIGHGLEINDLKFHPVDPNLLLSASKDNSVRLWNVQTDVCIVIFHGSDGHKCEVLSVDLDFRGRRIATSGKDNSVRIWQLNKPSIQQAIRASYKGQRGFTILFEHYPEHSVDGIHNRFVDCVKWMGNFLLSKSNENSIICWKPGHLPDDIPIDDSTTASVIHEFKYRGDEYFFIRFSLDVRMNYMSVGNDRGTTFLWKMNGNAPSARATHLRHSHCTGTVRATAFSFDSKILITVCDDGSVWKWDKISSI